MQLVAVRADREAQARGLAVRRLDYIFVILITILTVACVKIVGAVLVEALLLIPAAAAQRVARTPEQMALYASLLGMVAVAAGLTASWFWDTPAGPSVVVAALADFLALYSLPRGLRRA